VARDALLGGRVKLRQPVPGYRVAIDTVFLAASLSPRPGIRLLDLGCGVGGASLCLLARLEAEAVPGVSVLGLEIQPELVQLANENATANGRARAFRAIKGDLTRLPMVFEPLSFDGVFFNPPYGRAKEMTPPNDPVRNRANLECDEGLDLWISTALKLLKPKGTITLIHRAERLGEILGLLEGRAGAIRILPLHSKARRPAKRVIVSALKNSRAPLGLLPGFVVHDDDGAFTAEAEAVLRRGAALPLRDDA
jgi:tRNA1(Val) A37 N6-methylase TrmN6